MLFSRLCFYLSFVSISCVGQQQSPSFPAEYFEGAQHRPKLEIVRPENGEVLDDVRLEIRVRVTGYELPSSFHDSKMCISLSSGSTSAEKCFERQPEPLEFHVDGLTPGAQYALRVAYYERASVLAASVRHFRVGGVRLLLEGGAEAGGAPVAIRTAVQRAVQLMSGASPPTHSLTHAHTSTDELQMRRRKDAEQIFLRVLEEQPSHAPSLHLLGRLFLAQGDLSQAEKYIREALRDRRSGRDSGREESAKAGGTESFRNSLGECYALLGREQEAQEQFREALALRPDFQLALFNLGIVQQSMGRAQWPEALNSFSRVNELIHSSSSSSSSSSTSSTSSPSSSFSLPLIEPLSIQQAEQSQLRECDLMTALSSLPVLSSSTTSPYTLDRAKKCWATATNRFPLSGQIRNELATIFAREGEYATALELFRSAAELGSFVAELNTAHILEIEGFAEESRQVYEDALTRVSSGGLPVYHIRVRLAGVLPRIMPATESSLLAIRQRMTSELQDALSCDSSLVTVDNGPPLHLGLTRGHSLAFHGVRNDDLKSLLARVYLRMCPALASGIFMTGKQSANISTGSNFSNSFQNEKNENYEMNEFQKYSFASSFWNRWDMWSEENSSCVDLKYFQIETNKESPTISPVPSVPPPSFSSSRLFSEVEDDLDGEQMKKVIDRGGSKKKIKVGIISRHFSQHFISGYLTLGLLKVLSSFPNIQPILLRIPKDTYAHFDSNSSTTEIESESRHDITINMSELLENEESEFETKKNQENHNSIESEEIQEPLFKDIISQINNMNGSVVYLPSGEGGGLGFVSAAVRELRLDLLLFPEIGVDPVTYFLAFARLATVQACWFGHPDTTGIPNIDYFISSDIETTDLSSSDKNGKESSKVLNLGPEGYSKGLALGYSEILVKMRGLGVSLADPLYYFSLNASSSSCLGNYNGGVVSARVMQLCRSALTEKLSLPRAAHLYVVAQPLTNIHPNFDQVLSKLLLSDRLAHILIFEPQLSRRQSWKRLFTLRLAGHFSPELRQRLLFPSLSPSSSSSSSLALLEALAGAHCLLDPFPGSAPMSALLALSVGLPVITMPAHALAGRLTLAAYREMQFPFTEHSHSSSPSASSSPSSLSSSLHSLPGLKTSANRVVEWSGEDLVVLSVQQYVATALAIAHRPRLRDSHLSALMLRKPLLFNNQISRERAAADWSTFISSSLNVSLSN